MGAVVAVFVMAVLYEGLKSLREYLLWLGLRCSGSDDSGDDTIPLTSQSKQRPRAYRSTKREKG